MKRTGKWVVAVWAITIVFSVSTVVLAQPRSGQREAPTVTRDVLIQRAGLSAKQADKVIKVHKRHAASMKKAQEKFRRQTEKIRKSEAEDLAKIVGKEQLPQLERLLRPRRRMPFWGQEGSPVRGQGRGSPEVRGPRFDIGRLQEWARNLTDITPEQKEKMRTLMERHREQFRTLQEKFRKKLAEILTSEQMERFRPGRRGGEER